MKYCSWWNTNSSHKSLWIVKQISNWWITTSGCASVSVNSCPWESWTADIIAIRYNCINGTCLNTISVANGSYRVVKIGVRIILCNTVLLSTYVSTSIGGSEYFGCVSICPSLNCTIEHCDHISNEQNTADYISALPLSLTQRTILNVSKIGFLFTFFWVFCGHI